MGMSQGNGMPRPPPSQNGPQPMDTSMPPTIPIPKQLSGRGIGKQLIISRNAFKINMKEVQESFVCVFERSQSTKLTLKMLF